MASTWTITELAERAVAVLTAGDPVRVNGRVRDLPNERLIRWYTTIGLVDPPLGRRGRTALYGPRHLLQLVAVKRRQAAGRTIAEIQAELTGATDATLRRIARITEPPEVHAAHEGRRTPADTRPGDIDVEPDDGASVAHPIEPASPRSRFWTARPAESAAPAMSALVPGDGTVGADGAVPPDTADGGGSAEADVRRSLVQGVRLASGLTLLLDVPALSRDDLAAITDAAGPLLDELRRRGLIAPLDTPTDPPGRPQ